ncbi:MAG: CoA transferase [SAR202 cluster bacterium]|jgi:crotonobetainyl-CoA:carnitine CoA-transferase CaiB-like acyl-CoA transferase|nr:CoA transferase [SAR202 cluster bacterium]MDP6663640.1 CoA transferase [SAR202 cluster bacterium]MQG56600.1 CoA transferase [SAR202 cluster bacterium]MQG70447.1 CoA transferase [SAR202 cluster bacterium]HAL49174.1 CoA transferase [Dehalococcoidia bacterium]|tara:strand:- start:1104 stop:2294 length:1191 start_codon:yes stop_codon:yes gene_type:complete
MGALDNIVVLDLSRILAGPYSTQILADLGATVWKIESPWGDDTRKWGPPFQETESSYFLSANRGKKSLIVNLRDERGQAIIRQMAQKADVLVENFKSGDLARYGLDYDALAEINPRLVYASVTGFGQTGPRAAEPGYDAALQGMTGIMSVSGEPDGPPTKVGVAWIDILTGLNTTIGILTALHDRHSSGLGQRVDVSLFDSGIAAMANLAQSYLATHVAPGRIGTAHPQIAPYQAFEASDGYFMLAVGNDNQFRRVCDALELSELPNDPRYADNAGRVENRDALVQLYSDVFRTKTRDHWIEVIGGIGVTVTPVNTLADIFEDPQAVARKSLWDMDHPTIGKIQVIGSALQHLSRTPAAPSTPPPLLGEHTREVLGEALGIPEDEIAELFESGVVK